MLIYLTMVKRGITRLKEMTIFTYSIDHLLKKDKIRFYYALKGRDGKSGIVKDYDIDQLGRAVLLVPTSKTKEFEDFMHLWKCKFEEREVLLK